MGMWKVPSLVPVLVMENVLATIWCSATRGPKSTEVVETSSRGDGGSLGRKEVMNLPVVQCTCRKCLMLAYSENLSMDSIREVLGIFLIPPPVTISTTNFIKVANTEKCAWKKY